MEIILLKSGITVESHIPRFGNPRKEGYILIVGVDDQFRPFRLSMNYEEACKLMEVLSPFIAKIVELERSKGGEGGKAEGTL